MHELRVDHLLAWCKRMLDPTPGAEFEPYASLAPTLEPLLKEEVAGRFLPWAAANSRAVAVGLPEFTVTIGSRQFAQRAQRYPAKSFSALRQKLQGVANLPVLESLLAETGCAAWLQDN
jgi:hypothetical protein